MTKELKPCPFCGGEAKIIHLTNKDYNNISATCTTCFVGMHLFNDEQEAIDTWNTRAYENTHDKFNPDYYKSRDKSLEAIDYIEAYDLNFNLGNVIKYITRAGSKNGEITQEALNKALWYINREISRLKAKQQEEEAK